MDVVVELGEEALKRGALKRSVKTGGVGMDNGGFVVVDVKSGGGKGESEEECRICHLSSDPQRQDGSELIQLGCACKNELGTAHRHCAEAWFKLRGGRNCEICGLCAKNIMGVENKNFLEEWSENRMVNDLNNENSSERRRCWSSQPFCNFLMACLVIAFIIPWFFRVNMF